MVEKLDNKRANLKDKSVGLILLQR